MDFIALIILTLQITNAFSKKKHRYSTEESSFENLVFYQDCKHNPKTPPPVLRAAEPPKPICPCPKMCCSMCCDCNDQPSVGRSSISMMSGLMQPPAQPNPVQPFQNPKNQGLPILPKHRRNRLQPFSTRRLAGFTKEDIKKLVSKDDDIKKILKDLVKVTMQKVDLVGMLEMNGAKGEDAGENNYETDKDSSDEDELE